MSDPTPRSFDTQPSGPAVGQDEWVARHGERRLVRTGPLGIVEARLRQAPWWAWLLLFTGAICLMPAISGSGYVRRVGFDTTLYMMLALGLNVVVGWAGLLDLGYVAFWGVGAYTYALFDSHQLGIHLPTIAAIPTVVVVGAIVGFLLGLPSKRLSGDYLAIVTLFFLQIFLTVTTNGDQVLGHNVTGGANGILNVDPLSWFGHPLATNHQGVFAVSYYYVAIAFFLVVFVALRFVNNSRTGRAWRSLREDPLAAEAMGMPVNSLKLLAFAFGAAVAALTGTMFAALSSSVFPLTFYFTALITIYTMVILGGAGSMAGVVGGAIIINVLLELLRDPGKARVVFYIVLAGGILLGFRRSVRLGVVTAATVAFGFVMHAVADAVDHSWVTGATGSSGKAFGSWVVVPAQLARWLPAVSYVGLIAMVLALTMIRGRLRLVLLVPTLYFAAFVWENVMIRSASAIAPMRFIVIGLILIALMILRPNGLLGKRRVEIV
jgi:ABC-type branched-subunit amino acid transport system permease subunit